MSCSILYTWITSALSRLYSNEGNPNARSLSLYGKCDIHLTSFVARLCTFSRAILSFLKTGDHTDDAYSKCVRTKDLNKFKKMSLSRYVKVRNMVGSKSHCRAVPAVPSPIWCASNLIFIDDLSLKL